MNQSKQVNPQTFYAIFTAFILRDRYNYCKQLLRDNILEVF